MWEHLMKKIGMRILVSALNKADESFEDKMLQEWGRVHTVPVQLSQPRPLYGQNQHSSKFFRCRVGTLLRTRASEHFVLDQQFIHKSLQLVVRDTEELTMTLILNRHSSASATMVSINAKGVRSPIKKHVFFGGPSSNNTSWWLCVQPAGTISVYSEREALVSITRKEAQVEDFIIVRGCVVWPKGQKHSNGPGSLQWQLQTRNIQMMKKLPVEILERMREMSHVQDLHSNRTDLSSRHFEGQISLKSSLIRIRIRLHKRLASDCC